VHNIFFKDYKSLDFLLSVFCTELYQFQDNRDFFNKIKYRSTFLPKLRRFFTVFVIPSCSVILFPFPMLDFYSIFPLLQLRDNSLE